MTPPDPPDDRSGHDQSALPEPEHGHELAVSPDIVLDTFDHMDVIALTFEGPDLVLAAWNDLGRKVVQKAFHLGEPTRHSVWMRGSPYLDKLIAVYHSGEPTSGSEWPYALPTDNGGLREAFFNFRYVPWRRPDGSIRGVIAIGVEVTEQVTGRQTAEATAERWEGPFRSSHDAMASLQSAMLPGRVPVLPGVELAARYLVAETDTAAGGDWFSALELGDGRVALVVGDVVGHGVLACATMGQLRAVLEQRLLDGADIRTAVTQLEAFAVHLGVDAAATTVCVAVLDPMTGVLDYCTAGHPAPLVVSDEQWLYLDLTGASPLGSGSSITTGRYVLPVGATVFLYSDGLVERPGRARPDSTAEIGQVVTHALHGRPISPTAPTHLPDRACEQACEQLTRETGYDDDITVLAARRVEMTAPFHLRLPSDQVGIETTAAVDRWLARLGAGDQDRRRIRDALVELLANSVEHAPRAAEGRPVEVRIDADLDRSGLVTISVSDTGVWREPVATPSTAEPSGHPRLRGFGLALVTQLVDGLDVSHDRDGTRVEIHHRLSRPAGILGGYSRPPGMEWSAETPFETTTDPRKPGTVHVRGPVTGHTAARFRAILDLESRAATQPLTVDLNGVTQLASAGVRVLHLHLAQAQTRGGSLTLLADPGTPAHDVLTLIGMFGGAGTG